MKMGLREVVCEDVDLLKTGNLSKHKILRFLIKNTLKLNELK
jgi:hypothetical protein